MYTNHREGLLATNISSAFGGIKHTSTKKGGRTIVTTISTRDPHPKLTSKMKALVNKSDYACRKLCAATPVGWILPAAQADLLREEFATLNDEARDLNHEAEMAGSRRRVRLGVVLARFVEPAQQFAAVDQAVQDGLHAFAEALRDGALHDYNGRRSPWRPILLKTANLGELYDGEALALWKRAIATATDARELFLKITKRRGNLRRALVAMEPSIKILEEIADQFGRGEWR